jgi:hypothetical protein
VYIRPNVSVWFRTIKAAVAYIETRL